MLTKPRERIETVDGTFRDETVLLENHTDDVPNVRLIIDHQDPAAVH
jgi:hypothetical protein